MAGAGEEDEAAIFLRRRKCLHSQDFPPTPRSGWLVPDHDIPDHGAGHVSFGRAGGEKPQKDDQNPGLSYIAVAPRLGSLQPTGTTQWTILPVHIHGEGIGRKDNGVLVRFNPISRHSIQVRSSSRHSLWLPSPQNAETSFPIYVLPTQPLLLSRVIIEVDMTALKKHDEVQTQFAGGFVDRHANGYNTRRKGKGNLSVDEAAKTKEARPLRLDQDLRIANAIKTALRRYTLLNTGLSIDLPLPTHPITHASFPPVRVVNCHPVLQGLLCPKTSIIIRPTSSPSTTPEKGHTSVNVVDNTDTTSDDSSDIISIEPPRVFHASTRSPGSCATPRPYDVESQAPQSPGSVLSAVTTSTLGPSHSGVGRTFQAYGLLGRIPDDVLHPTPAHDEDDEARVFVDMSSLIKLKCLSGDWITIEPTIENHGSIATSTAVEALAEDGHIGSMRRPVKIYGLPAVLLNVSHVSKDPPALHKRSAHVSSREHLLRNNKAWLSPVLLANLGNPRNIKVCKLMIGPASHVQNQGEHYSAHGGNRIMPPHADDMVLNRVSTPMSSEKVLQGPLLLCLKSYLEQRRRIHKEGDLIALSIDVSTGRLLGTTSSDEEAIQDIPARSMRRTAGRTQYINVAWFRVHRLRVKVMDDASDFSRMMNWCGAAVVEPTGTPIGVDQSMIPPTHKNFWAYYLHFRPLPASPKGAGPLAGFLRNSPPKSPLSIERRLKDLLAAATTPYAVHLDLDPTIILIHSSQRSTGKTQLSVNAVLDLGLHVFTVDAHELLAEGGSTEIELTFQARISRAQSCGADITILHIRHVESLTSGRMVTMLREAFASFRAVICTTSQLDSIPESIRTLFTHELEVQAPDEIERRSLLQSIIADRSLQVSPDVSLSSLALKTAALVAGNLVEIVDRAVLARQCRLTTVLEENRKMSSSSLHSTMQDLLLTADSSITDLSNADFSSAIDAARASFSDSIGAPKIPSVSWADVGGLANVKDAVMETIQLPLSRPELFAKGMKKRSGILFYGPPGTGKTLLAKAIATEFSLNFFSVKGPELLNMYIGESEANVRRVFQRARDARPCVVFFDELDSVAPKRGNQGDSGGVMDRIVSQLLAELDGMSDSSSSAHNASSNGGVFVIGATNRPDLLDQALLRPGRFDKLLYLGISDTHEKQETILRALTRKFHLDPSCSLARVAEKLPFTYTGADLYALCSDAMLKAVMRRAGDIDAHAEREDCTVAEFFDTYASTVDLEVLVGEQDFEKASRELVGSVSIKELEHYQRVRERFEQPEEGPITNGSLKDSKGKGKLLETNGHAPHQSKFGEQASPLLSKPTRRPKPIGRADTAIKSPPTNTTRIPQPEGLGRRSEVNGKGKVSQQWSGYTEDDDADEEDEGFVTSNDYDTPQRRRSILSKQNGFGNDAEDDGLY